jgi:hypothetical protein
VKRVASKASPGPAYYSTIDKKGQDKILDTSAIDTTTGRTFTKASKEPKVKISICKQHCYDVDKAKVKKINFFSFFSV